MTKMSATILEPAIGKLKLTKTAEHSVLCRYNDLQKLKFDSLYETSTHTKQNTKLQDSIAAIANKVRGPIVEIQEKRGISKNQRFTFVNLITNLFNQSFQACYSIVLMVIGLFPLMETLLFILRFVLDKILEINEINTNAKKLYGIAVFLCELCVIFVMVAFIKAIILIPAFYLILHNVFRVWGMLSG